MIFVAQKKNFYKKTPSNRKGTDGVGIFDCVGVNLTEECAVFWRFRAMQFH